MMEYWGVLANAGYHLTDENKEDIFIEIIEKDDDYLVDILEKYLNTKAQFEEYSQYFGFYDSLKDEFDYIDYYDFENLEEGLKVLEDKYNDIIQNNTVQNYKKDVEVFREIKKNFQEKNKLDQK